MAESAFDGGRLPRFRLLIPGPVEVDDAVLSEMGSPVAAHYGPRWTALYNETTERMRGVFRTSGDVFLLASSGSGGLEAALASLFAPGERVIIGVNGFFSGRLAEIARFRGIDVVPITAPLGQPLDVDVVQSVLSRDPRIAGLVAVHHETSTGVLNPIEELGALARAFDVPFVVDAVSSLGGEELAMDDWGIDICVTASQKCLEAPPGLASVAVGARAWAVMDRKRDYPAGWYLNLRVWRQYAEEWGEWHPFPVTLPTNNVLTLRVAIDRLYDEGLEGRIARYRDVALFLRAGLRDLGFELFVEGEYAANVITAVRRLPGMDVADMITTLREEHGIRISGGMGETSGEIFRVGHMGKAGSRADASLLLDALAAYLGPAR